MRSLVSLLGLLLLTTSCRAQELTSRPDWAPHFQGTSGTIVVVDERDGSSYVFDETRALQRFIPASTFKVPHALFALEAGVVKDEFQVFEWDGVEREIEAWNQNQDLRSSMRHSAVWVYRQLAREIGEAQERQYLEAAEYGNADPSGGVDRFWLDGGLRISAVEQVAFLQKLYRNELPFDIAHQRLVKDIMIVEADRLWILRAKTGWAADEFDIGWWVGWVEHPEGAVFFALNIDMANGMEDAPRRINITRRILEALGALPAS